MKELIEIGVTSPALLAYLDPGTGSLVFQILIAGLMSGAFFVRSWTRAVRRALGRLPRHG
jgi:hypothetical protein